MKARRQFFPHLQTLSPASSIYRNQDSGSFRPITGGGISMIVRRSMAAVSLAPVLAALVLLSGSAMAGQQLQLSAQSCPARRIDLI